MSEKEEPSPTKRAMIFIVFMGLVSLFADMTYEGARSITGPFLAILGASGTIVGIVSGFGEWIGYSLRLLFGYASDKTGRYWSFIFLGYAINVLAVPLLAFAGNWQVAAALILLERFGKAIRSPSKDAILSYATQSIGRGWGFGIHEAMDKTGAVLGPLLMALVLYYKESYQFGFAVLLIPSLLAIVVLFWAWKWIPNPSNMEIPVKELEVQGLTKPYWIYVGALCCVAAGFVDFPLMAYHFQKNSLYSPTFIPILYAITMGIAGIASLILGKLYDLKGMAVVIGFTIVTAFFSFFVFLGGPELGIIGMILWGIGLGAQESILRAVVANLVGVNKRATAYGMLNVWFGTAWFLGSGILGYLYDINLIYLVTFSFIAQIAAVPLLYIVSMMEKNKKLMK
jgi:MFS family permease